MKSLCWMRGFPVAVPADMPLLMSATSLYSALGSLAAEVVVVGKTPSRFF